MQYSLQSSPEVSSIYSNALESTLRHQPVQNPTDFERLIDRPLSAFEASLYELHVQEHRLDQELRDLREIAANHSNAQFSRIKKVIHIHQAASDFEAIDLVHKARTLGLKVGLMACCGLHSRCKKATYKELDPHEINTHKGYLTS